MKIRGLKILGVVFTIIIFTWPKFLDEGNFSALWVIISINNINEVFIDLWGPSGPGIRDLGGLETKGDDGKDKMSLPSSQKIHIL